MKAPFQFAQLALGWSAKNVLQATARLHDALQSSAS
jgi:hypothetical protein